jgi:hypothetical protein
MNQKERNLKLAKKIWIKLSLDPTSSMHYSFREYYFLKGEYETSYQIYSG